MANAIVKQQPIEDEHVALIKRMIAKDASNDELELFLHQCHRTGLDPLSKQIYAISRHSKRENRKVMSIQVSIDGQRLIAERTGRYDSQEGPYWCGEDGVWKDVWLEKGHPHAAKVLVYKVGSTRGTTGIAHWSEYADTTSSFWQSKPALMLAKCAESLALRKAFPQELSGLYTSEEMSQADNIIDVTPRTVNQDTGEIIDVLTSGPLASADKLRQLDEIGKELYKSSWSTAIIKWLAWASDTKVNSAEELSPEQADAIIEAIDKRLAARMAKAQEPVAEAA